jgi:hypothetical protein
MIYVGGLFTGSLSSLRAHQARTCIAVLNAEGTPKFFLAMRFS